MRNVNAIARFECFDVLVLRISRQVESIQVERTSCLGSWLVIYFMFISLSVFLIIDDGLFDWIRSLKMENTPLYKEINNIPLADDDPQGMYCF